MLIAFLSIIGFLFHLFIMSIYKHVIHSTHPKMKIIGYIPALNFIVLVVWSIRDILVQWYNDYKEVTKTDGDGK